MGNDILTVATGPYADGLSRPSQAIEICDGLDLAVIAQRSDIGRFFSWCDIMDVVELCDYRDRLAYGNVQGLKYRCLFLKRDTSGTSTEPLNLCGIYRT
ncbi:MAG: hypothetical protein ACX93I_07820 [Winogradskyella sp.]